MANNHVVFERDGSVHSYEGFSEIENLFEKCVVVYKDNKLDSLYLPKDNPINDSMPTIKDDFICFNYHVKFNHFINFKIPFEYLMKIAYITKEEFDKKIKNMESKINKIVLEEIVCEEEITKK